MMMSIDYNIQEVNYLLFNFIDIKLLFQNRLISSNIREVILYFIDIKLLFQNRCQLIITFKRWIICCSISLILNWCFKIDWLAITFERWFFWFYRYWIIVSKQMSINLSTTFKRWIIYCLISLVLNYFSKTDVIDYNIKEVNYLIS